VFQIDVVWPGILANHFIDLSKAAAKQSTSISRRSSRTTRSGGKLVGIPWFTDAGVLYYRKDLLEKYGAKAAHHVEELTRDCAEGAGR